MVDSERVVEVGMGQQYVFQRQGVAGDEVLNQGGFLGVGHAWVHDSGLVAAFVPYYICVLAKEVEFKSLEFHKRVCLAV